MSKLRRQFVVLERRGWYIRSKEKHERLEAARKDDLDATYWAGYWGGFFSWIFVVVVVLWNIWFWFVSK